MVNIFFVVSFMIFLSHFSDSQVNSNVDDRGAAIDKCSKESDLKYREAERQLEVTFTKLFIFPNKIQFTS